MTWSSVWSYKIDGTEINDGTNYWTTIPEIENVFAMDAILAPIDGDYPMLIRLQPKEGSYTLQTWAPGEPAAWDTKLATLKALLTQAPHTLSVQVRGMAAAKSVIVVPTTIIVSYTQRLLTATLLAPKPVLT